MPVSVEVTGRLAHPDIDADHFAQLLSCWLRHADFQSNEQREGVPGLIVPEFRITYRGPMPNEGKMLVVALVRDGGTPVQRTDADLLVQLEGVVTFIGILEGGRTVCGRLIQPLTAFPGDLFAAMFGILLELRPQSDVG